MPPIMTFIGNLGYVAVCVAGAVLTMKGTIGFEVIVAFMMYVRYFTQPLSQIAQAAQSLQLSLIHIFGLGAGKWRVIRTVVLPGCIDGVVTGCILSVGRIIGESAALLFTAGLAHAVNGMIDGLHSAGATLTVALYMYAKEQGEFGVAFAIAAILMVLTVFINLTATLLGKYFQRRKSQ